MFSLAPSRIFQRFFGSTKRFFNIPVRVALAACCAQGDCRWDLPPPTVLRLFHWRSLCLFGGRPMAGNIWPRSRGELVHFFSKRRARAPMAPTKASARAPRARGFWDARAPRLHNRCRKHFFRIGAIWSQPSGGTRCESLMSPSLGSEKIIWGLCFFFFVLGFWCQSCCLQQSIMRDVRFSRPNWPLALEAPPQDPPLRDSPLQDPPLQDSPVLRSPTTP